MILFEKDIYPAFTSGDNAKIIQSLDQVIEQVKKSSQDADAVFRLINWSWPALTTRARTSSEDGIKIVERYTGLMTTLMSQMSSGLLSQLGDCKSVLRAVVRGLNVIDIEIAVNYLKAIEDRVLPLKIVRGFFLDRVAMDHILAFTAAADEVGEASIRLVVEVLKSRRLYNTEQVADFLARLAKLNSCNATSASVSRQVLSSHNSGQLYDQFMEKLTFVQLGGGEDSCLRRLTVVNFLIQIAGSRCPGERLPFCITKSELTNPILNWKTNRLVAIFTMRLVRTVLSRLDPRREPVLMGLVRDRLVELNSIVPVIKQIMSVSKNAGEQFLLVSELTSLVLEYKRALPGSFVDCKYDWTKILEEFPNAESHVRKLLVRFVFNLHKATVPVSQNLARLFSRIRSSGEDETVFACFQEWLGSNHCSGRILGLDEVSAAGLMHVLRKTGMEMATKLMTWLVGEIVKNPSQLSKCSLIELLENNTEFADLVPAINKRILKRKRKAVTDEVGEEDNTVQATTGEERKIPNLSVSKRHKCPPLPEPLTDPYDRVLAGWQSMILANDIASTQAIDLIDMAGSNKLYSAIVSLASEDECVRKSAYEILALVLRALAVSIEAKGVDTWRFVFREAPQMAMILTWLRNGIPAPDEGKLCPEPLPLVTVIFVVEALKIIFDPKNVLYTPVYKFILSRVGVNAHGDVPMWTELFLSEDAANIRAFRAWVVEILSRAAGDKKSVEIMIRRGVIETLLDSGINLIATPEELDAILGIITTALRTANEETELVNRYAMCQWIQAVVNSRHVKFVDA